MNHLDFLRDIGLRVLCIISASLASVYHYAIPLKLISFFFWPRSLSHPPPEVTRNIMTSALYRNCNSKACLILRYRESCLECPLISLNISSELMSLFLVQSLSLPVGLLIINLFNALVTLLIIRVFFQGQIAILELCIWHVEKAFSKQLGDF